MQNGSITIRIPSTTNRTSKQFLWERFQSQFCMRPPDDDGPQDWWIASTAIPLIAATAGPLANVMSIVALVMPWRNNIIVDSTTGSAVLIQKGFPDPRCKKLLGEGRSRTRYALKRARKRRGAHVTDAHLILMADAVSRTSQLLRPNRKEQSIEAEEENEERAQVQQAPRLRKSTSS